MAIIMEWLLIATQLLHHQLYFMLRYCLQNLMLDRSQVTDYFVLLF